MDFYKIWTYINHTFYTQLVFVFFYIFFTIATVPVIYYKLITDEILETLEGSGHTHTSTSRISEE